MGKVYNGSEAVAIEMILKAGDIKPWLPSVEAARNLILGTGVGSLSLSEHFNGDTDLDGGLESIELLKKSCNTMRAAVSAGRLIDFGYLPNDIIKSEGKRAAQLYQDGHIGQPFNEPWALFHTWEGGANLYLVQLIDGERPNGGTMMIEEFVGITIRGVGVFPIANRAVVACKDGRYDGVIHPSPWNLPEDGETITIANVADPVILAMLLLVTQGVKAETVPAPAKLNKHRAKAGKFLIPSHTNVNMKDYITALQNKKVSKGVRGDGHHASPVTHLRRGHIRRLANGTTTWIRDAIVNENKDNSFTHRSHYKR